MPFAYQPEEINVNLDNFGYQNLPTSLGETLSAVAEDAFVNNPTTAISRMMGPSVQLEKQYPTVLAPEVANEKYGVGNLKFEEPVQEAVAKVKYDRKLAEMKREDIISRGPSGVGPFAAKLGTGFLVGATDPLNIAAAFVPIVGEARYASWANNIGRVRAGIAKGAVEGFVGTAAIEPLPYLAAKNDGLNYDLMDSFLNVTFGTVLGGGLHAAGSALEVRAIRQRERAQNAALDVVRGTGDEFSARMESLTPQTKEALGRSAVGQAADGRLPHGMDVIFRAGEDEPPRSNAEIADINSPRENVSPDQPKNEAFSQAEAIKQQFEEFGRADVNKPKDLQSSLGYRPVSLSQFVKKTGGIVDDSGELRARDIKGKSLPGLIRKNRIAAEGRGIDDVKLSAWEAGYFPEKQDYNDITDSEFYDAIAADVNGNKIYNRADREHVETVGALETNLRQYEAMGITGDMSIEDIARVLRGQEFVETVGDSEPRGFDDFMREQQEIENDYYPDWIAEKEFNQQFENLPKVEDFNLFKAEADVAQQMLDEQLAALGVDDAAVKALMGAHDQAIKEAQQMEKVYKATAFCVARVG